MATSLSGALRKLTSELVETRSLDATVDQIVRSACEAIGADNAGISLVVQGGKAFETVGQTDQLVAEADLLQYELREGPCVDAALKMKTLWSPDLAGDERWPRWGVKASELGFHSILSVQLRCRGQRIGAMNLYGQRFRQFTAEDAETVELFAYHAAAALAAARHEGDLQQALDSRLLIGQAQGILMERFDVDAHQAFNILRRYSQDTNVRLVAVARDLVDSRSLPAVESKIDTRPR